MFWVIHLPPDHHRLPHPRLGLAWSVVRLLWPQWAVQMVS